MSIAKRAVFADATTKRKCGWILEQFKAWSPEPSAGGPKPDVKQAPPKKARTRKPKKKIL